MKKYFLLLCFIFCANTVVVNANNALNFSTNNSTTSDEDMEFVQQTTAWQWNTVAWFDSKASIFKNRRDGSYWVKIVILATPGYVVCRVQNNPDYTTGLGAIKGGCRTSKKYMAVGNGITYYFDM